MNLRLQIEQAGAEVLHRPSRSLEPAELALPETQNLIDLMFATLAGTGVGLAAPQVGVGLRLVVIEDPPAFHALVPSELLAAQERVPVEPHVLVNPVLELLDDAQSAAFFEGCLSVEGYRAVVPRARHVRVRALDRYGEPFEREATGWYARILQHECDHLDGRLYVERMLPRTFFTAQAVAKHWSKLPIEQVIEQHRVRGRS